MICSKTRLGYYLIPVQLHFPKVNQFPRPGGSPGFRGPLKFWNPCCQRVCIIERSPVLQRWTCPVAIPCEIPASSNMLTVPDHIRLAPLLGLVDGYASTMLPPFFLIEARAAFRPNPATPLRRLFLSTKKQVIRQSFFPPLPRLRLW